MNNEERKIFWDTLNILDGRDFQKDFEKIKTTIYYPEELCKFKRVDDYSLLGLQTNQLYISPAIQYDDPFDTFLYIDWQKLDKLDNQFKNYSLYGYNKYCIDYNEPFSDEGFQHYKASIENKSIHKKMIQSLKDTRSKMQEILKSISFTENFKNETLWLKYADNHKGFCLVYNLKEKLKDIERLLFPIYYSSTPFDATTYAFYLELFKRNNERTKALLAEFEMNTRYDDFKVSLIKKECHHYDQEWRYLSPNQNQQYLEWKPSKIIIGLRTPEHHIELIKNSAKIAGIQNIYQVCINSKDEFDIVQLNV